MYGTVEEAEGTVLSLLLDVELQDEVAENGEAAEEDTQQPDVWPPEGLEEV